MGARPEIHQELSVPVMGREVIEGERDFSDRQGHGFSPPSLRPHVRHRLFP
ncbi:hypothetical protein chiPu_0030128, partial [Chiloscyllium punctatum]|nr:hypothetical protein [Chiloscyllium punctatum]